MSGILYRCTHCTFKSYTQGVLRAHCKVFHHGLKLKRSGRFLIAKPCNNSKHRTKRAEQGQSIENTIQSNSECPYCRHKSTTRWNLKQHIVSCHINIRQLKCQRCRKSFSSKYKLKRHMATHSSVRKFKCNFCSFTATRKGRVNSHIKEMHAEFKQFRCNLCEARFKRNSHLQNHMSSVHSSKTLSCKICDKRLSSMDTLVAHMKIHQEKAVPAKCEICHRMYGSQRKLKRHVETMHGNRNTFNCKICGLKFTAIGTLSGHMKRKHYKKELTFKCTMCPKVYTNIGPLKHHIKTVHNDGKPDSSYQCSQCSASFISKHLLQRHYPVHGMKRFKCGFCNAVFRLRSTLTAHMFTHKKTKQYQCSVCLLKCRHTSDLKMHLKTHTNDRTVKCKHESCDRLFTEKRNMMSHWREVHLKLKQQKCTICEKICSNGGSLQVSLQEYTY